MGPFYAGERLREVLRAVTQDHRLARAGHAVNHPMALPHAPCELLLLEIHHPAAKRHPEHPPEPLLKRLRVHRLHHLVLANHALGRNDLPQIGQRESVARDIRKNHAIAPWANQLALIA